MDEEDGVAVGPTHADPTIPVDVLALIDRGRDELAADEAAVLAEEERRQREERERQEAVRLEILKAVAADAPRGLMPFVKVQMVGEDKCWVRILAPGCVEVRGGYVRGCSVWYHSGHTWETDKFTGGLGIVHLPTLARALATARRTWLKLAEQEARRREEEKDIPF